MFTIKEFLKVEVKPALGCTEPGAVALGVARAVEALEGQKPEKIEVTVSDSIYKNGMYVGIPGTSGLKGNDIAAALGALCGKSEYGLEVLKDCTKDAVEKANKMLEEKMVSIIPDLSRHGVYVEALVSAANSKAVCVIEKAHSNITLVKKDSEVVFDGVNGNNNGNGNGESIPDQVSRMSYKELVSLVDDMDEEDVEHVMDGVEMNFKIAAYGFDHDTGINLGSTIRELAGDHYDSDDLSSKIKAVSTAASDARMDGAPLPVMSSAGSGNHGITAIIPVAVAGEHYGKTRKEIASAIAFSHLTTSFIKSRMGRLSPVCGCSVAAGAGSAAGLVKLLGGDVKTAVKAIELVIGNLVGMLCDGAKETCSLKVGTGASEAYYAAMLALKGNGLTVPQGVIDDTIEKTVENAARVNLEGMKDVDSIIIDVIQQRFPQA